MAFGFPAYHTQELQNTGSLTAFRERVAIAIRSLGWLVQEESDMELTASTAASLWSWEERITVRFHKGGASVTSSCTLFTQCIDWGKNKQNVHRLLSVINQADLDTVIEASVRPNDDPWGMNVP
jgi:hypothetical protein